MPSEPERGFLGSLLADPYRLRPVVSLRPKLGPRPSVMCRDHVENQVTIWMLRQGRIALGLKRRAKLVPVTFVHGMIETGCIGLCQRLAFCATDGRLPPLPILAQVMVLARLDDSVC